MALIPWIERNILGSGDEQQQQQQHPADQVSDNTPGVMERVSGAVMPGGYNQMIESMSPEQADQVRRGMVSRGLMSLGAGLLQAGQPTLDPRKSGIGAGLASGMQLMNQSQNQYMQNYLAGQQAARKQEELQLQRDQQRRYQNYLQGLMGGGGQAPTSPGQSAATTVQAPTNATAQPQLPSDEQLLQKSYELTGTQGPTPQNQQMFNELKNRRDTALAQREAQLMPKMNVGETREVPDAGQRAPARGRGAATGGRLPSGLTRQDIAAASVMSPKEGVKYLQEQRNKAREAPPDRSYKTTDEQGNVVQVTEQWNRDTGRYEQIAAAPTDQFAPPKITRLINDYQAAVENEGENSFRAKSLKRRIQTLGQGSGFSVFDEKGNLLATQGPVNEAIQQMSESKRAGMLRNMQSQKRRMLNVITQGTNIMNRLDPEKNPQAESLVGNAGRFQRFLDSAVNQLEGVRQIITDERVSNAGESIESFEPQVEWGRAAQSQALQSRLKYFAYDLITGLQGSRPSDRDLQMALDMIAQQSGSPEQIRNAVKNVMDIFTNKFRINYYTNTGKTPNINKDLKALDIPYRLDTSKTLPEDMAREQETRDTGRTEDQTQQGPRRDQYGDPLPEGIPDGSTLLKKREDGIIYKGPDGSNWLFTREE